MNANTPLNIHGVFFIVCNIISTMDSESATVNYGEGLNDNKKQIVADFYNSFRWSIGDTPLQIQLFSFLAMEYDEETKREVLSMDPALIENLHLPKGHIEMNENYRKDMFIEYFNNFKKAVIEDQQQNENETAKEKEKRGDSLMNEIILGMLDRDANSLKKRHKYSSNIYKYRSVIREDILEV